MAVRGRKEVHEVLSCPLKFGLLAQMAVNRFINKKFMCWLFFRYELFCEGFEVLTELTQTWRWRRRRRKRDVWYHKYVGDGNYWEDCPF